VCNFDIVICAMSPLSIGLTILFVFGPLLLMRTRRFYFVRHGETLLNSQHIKQGEDGKLSERGRHQAEQVGTYLKRFNIGRIIASTYPRAKETSEIINEDLHVPIVYSRFFVERRSPNEVIGKSVRDPKVIDIIDRTELSYHEDDYRYSNEENFIDLRVRARKALNLLARQGTLETCVVTHRAFLKMLIAYMLYREHLHAPDFVKLSFYNYSDNAGITVCEFHPWKIFSPTRGWEVISYNEQP
jgi:broad specificity phosphatase PhoE